ncbi:MAG: tetratricopeptide repeat protein, partial [Methanobacteriota archaeon]
IPSRVRTLVSGEDVYDVLERAHTAGDAGNAATAISLLSRILSSPHLTQQLRPGELGQVHYNLGYTYERVGNVQAALAQYQQTMRVAPRFEQGYVQAAWVYNTLGQPGAAASLLQQAVDLGIASPPVYSHLGDMYNNLMQFDKAVTTYERGLRVLQRHARKDERTKALLMTLYTALSDCHLNRLNLTAAATYARQALALDAHSAAAMASLFPALRELADWSEYDALLERMRTQVERALAKNEPSPLSAYSMLFADFPTALRRRAAASHSSRAVAVGAPLPPRNSTAERAALAAAPDSFRMALVSRRLHHYAGTLLMLDLFPQFVRQGRHMSCLSTGPDDGKEEQRMLRRTCAAFLDVSLENARDTAVA